MDFSKFLLPPYLYYVKKEGKKFGIIARWIKIVIFEMGYMANPDKIFYAMKTKNVLFLFRICFTETKIVFL